jgi:type I restriction enzyme M protein
MVVVLSHGALSRMRAEGKIRQNLLKMDLLEAVIGLGSLVTPSCLLPQP